MVLLCKWDNLEDTRNHNHLHEVFLNYNFHRIETLDCNNNVSINKSLLHYVQILTKIIMIMISMCIILIKRYHCYCHFDCFSIFLTSMSVPGAPLTACPSSNPRPIASRDCFNALKKFVAWQAWPDSVASILNRRASSSFRLNSFIASGTACRKWALIWGMKYNTCKQGPGLLFWSDWPCLNIACWEDRISGDKVSFTHEFLFSKQAYYQNQNP